MNSVILIGRLVRDPELSYFNGSANSVCKFTIAVDKGLSKEKKMEFEKANKPTADFIRIISWGKLADNCAKFLKKGLKVAVNGSITTGSYQNNNGNVIYTVDVTANQVEFIEWANQNQAMNQNFGQNYQNQGFNQNQGYNFNQPNRQDFNQVNQGFNQYNNSGLNDDYPDMGMQMPTRLDDADYEDSFSAIDNGGNIPF